ncbi:MAG: glycosyltransferase family 4 protein [Akkermansiaceae bacterium]
MADDIELILGNSNSRFSGVTSTMLQVLGYQLDIFDLAVLGKHFLPKGVRIVGFFELAKICRSALPSGKYRVFHARRNDEVIQALILKKIFGAKIRIAFTATAQRYPSWITRFLIRQSDAVITTSQAANHYILGGADVIIPHGVKTDVYEPAVCREATWAELGFPGKYGIGIFGRVRHQKGIDILVEAVLPLLKSFPDFTVVICGKTMPKDQEYELKLRTAIAEAGVTERFVFLGERPFDEIPKLFSAMTIVAALSRNEGFGLTVPEAMASGCAVIASEAGAWKDIVRDEVDGYIVPVENISLTREKLGDMMSDIKKTELMGRAARQRVISDFTIEREAAKLSDFLKSLSSVQSS